DLSSCTVIGIFESRFSLSRPLDNFNRLIAEVIGRRRDLPVLCQIDEVARSIIVICRLPSYLIDLLSDETKRVVMPLFCKGDLSITVICRAGNEVRLCVIGVDDLFDEHLLSLLKV